ncbi:MAG TPA: hypothetical protein VM364_00820 [Vicinamibacterales bacterium]|nr:hypothetical protein [Vicinamibacterales bacterium]
MDVLDLIVAQRNFESAAASAHTALFRAEQVLHERALRTSTAIAQTRAAIADAIRACDAILAQLETNGGNGAAA